MNLIRRALALVGLQPLAATGYRSVRVITRDGGAPTHGSGDYHAKYDRIKAVGISREFFRDNTIYKGLIQTAAEVIVGNGFGLQVRTSNPAWNSKMEAIFKAWSLKPEIRETMPWHATQRMVAQELLLCGDVGVIKTNRGKLQIVEAEQIVGPGMTDDGIKRDPAGAPLSYFVAPYRATGGGPDTAAAQAVASEDFIFVVKPERPTSLRGIPVCQSSFTMLVRINDVCDNEAFAFELLSRLALSITRAGGAALAYQESQADGTKTPEDGDIAKRVQLFDGGLVFHGEPGEEVKGIDHNIPGKDFTASITTFLRLIGISLGLPLEYVMLDWTKTNYSQARAILERTSARFVDWQMLLETFFHRPVYEWVAQRAIASGEIAAHPEWASHEWIKPASPWIDQLKEAEASGLLVDRGFTTHAIVLKSRNQDREEVLIQLEREVVEAITIAQKIEAETGVAVDWQMFAGRSIPKVEAPASGEEAEPEADETEEDEEAAKSVTPDGRFSALLGEVQGPMLSKGLAALLRSRRNGT